MLKNKNIVIGVTGGIAAYKAAEVINRLQKEKANTYVIMTKNACEFITPLTLQTLSKNMVVTDMFEKVINWEVEHIALATKADLFLVVPATANIIGKVANGIADDMLSTTIMATKAPVVFSLAMNENMYENPIVQSNIKKLKKHGYYFVEPEMGMLACGVRGKGKLAKPENILNYIENVLKEMK
jgi:phosphopantothenoylcysteine decarboxylase / phosphopantothenate---cysteine ligase